MKLHQQLLKIYDDEIHSMDLAGLAARAAIETLLKHWADSDGVYPRDIDDVVALLNNWRAKVEAARPAQFTHVNPGGDWTDIPLAEALALVAQGKATELWPDEDHYGDGTRSFQCEAPCPKCDTHGEYDDAACIACEGTGWLLAENDDYGVQIERCDSCQRFANDDIAAAHAFAATDENEN